MLMSSNNTSRVTKVCFIAPKAYPLFNPDVKKVFGGAEVDLYFLATVLGLGTLCGFVHLQGHTLSL